ncbi:MAG: DNA methyltransferase [Candidatus Nanoarchaeia archaeon]
MHYLFQLSGESLDLAQQELEALFYPRKFIIKKRFNNFLLVKANVSEDFVKKISERSAFLHLASLVIKELKSLMLVELDKVNWSFVKAPFCVRVIDLTNLAAPRLEARLAGPIYHHLIHERGKTPSALVSLENPKTTVLFVITDGKVYVAKLLWRASKGRFVQREPIKKPAFHPTSLKPKLARLLVNLSRAKKNQTLLDPFCGTGSVLIEAAILGCKPIGTDIDAEMVKGSKTNLKFYKLRAKVQEGNALELEKLFKPNSIDAIATDPPYGKSTKVGARSINALYRGFFATANKVLKPKHFLSLIYPHYIKAKKFVNNRIWKTIFESSLYVHGGLTRKFLVLQKR